MAGLRLVLGVDVEAGNQSHANVSMPGLLQLIDRSLATSAPGAYVGTGGSATTP